MLIKDVPLFPGWFTSKSKKWNAMTSKILYSGIFTI